jgi:NLR family CARD domain-containing protein 3
VNLDDQQLIDQDMEIVVREAIINKQCRLLLLRRNRITPIGALILADALRNNNTLEELYLTHNQVSDKGVHALAEALGINNNTLKQLGLGWNSITDKGAEHLAEMLKTNTKLLRMGLFNNEIGDRGVRLLAKALESPYRSLEGLCLDENTLVSDSSVDSLVNMIKHNQSLKELWVNKCSLSNKGAKRLQKATEVKRDFVLHCE